MSQPKFPRKTTEHKKPPKDSSGGERDRSQKRFQKVPGTNPNDASWMWEQSQPFSSQKPLILIHEDFALSFIPSTKFEMQAAPGPLPSPFF